MESKSPQKDDVSLNAETLNSSTFLFVCKCIQNINPKRLTMTTKEICSRAGSEGLFLQVL